MAAFKNLIRKKSTVIVLIVFFAVFLTAAFLRIEASPIVIGFSGDLTGQKSELGVQTRNGVQLAVEKINETGGIDGHRLEVSIKDDKGSAVAAIKADQELVDENVAAIIGHITSAQTMYGMEITEKHQMLMIGPTISTPLLSGKDDYFIRVYPAFDKSAQAYADYVCGEAKKKKIVIIYDADNSAYAKTYYSVFSEAYTAKGGKVLDVVAFSSANEKDFAPTISHFMALKPDGFLIIASDVDTAFIAQRSRVLGWDVQLFTTAWAQSQTLISSGGRAVEGMITEQAYPLQSQDLNFRQFETEYLNRFGSEPYFSAACGYEAAMVLAEALKVTHGKREGLKEAVLSIEEYQGISDPYSFDSYGDVQRPFYLSEIQGRTFTVIKKLTNNN